MMYNGQGISYFNQGLRVALSLAVCDYIRLMVFCDFSLQTLCAGAYAYFIIIHI